MFKPIRNLIGAGVLAALTAAAVGLARFLPELPVVFLDAEEPFGTFHYQKKE